MSSHTDETAHVRVAIIGAGFSGLGSAVRLMRAGVSDLLIFERADDVGGVWRDNRYPGSACDVESHLYSFSFALNPNWSHSFSGQPEIWEYLRRCARDYGLLPRIRFGHEVLSARWEPPAARWRIVTTQGEYSASVLVMASGALSEPATPALPGIEGFAGPAFHSARWDDGVDLRGRRVAVIGTGASAIQFVPQIQPLVARLSLFQRTPPWVLPRPGRPISDAERLLFRRLPIAQRARRAWIYAVRELLGLGFRHPRLMASLERVARRHLAESVPDPALRARLTPDYTIGCKRILLSSDYYPAIARPNVELVTAGVAEVRPRSILGADGVERPADAIIFGTGFQVTDLPFARHVFRGDGRSLADVWGGSPRAYLGTAVAGFPNLFILQGPGTGLGHSSVLLMIEAQIDHIVGAVAYMGRRGVVALEPRESAQAAFVADLDRRMAGTVWTAGGCRSWYLDRTGRNSTLWPGSVGSFRRRASRFAPRAYVMSRRVAQG